MRTIVDIKPPENSSPPLSTPEPVPLQVEMPAVAIDHSRMQIVPAYKQKIPFDLPDDWIVEVRPRSNTANAHYDKYFHEPETGRKFRSLASARRYLYGEQEPKHKKRRNNCQIVPYRNVKVFKGVMYNGKVLRPDQLEEARYSNVEEIYPRNLQFHNSGVLPDGWIIEFHPRATTTDKHIDRYYLEPGTGRKFRSLISVMRYLTGEEEPLRRPIQNNCLVPYQNSGVSRKIVYGGKVMKPNELEEARCSKQQENRPQTSRFSEATTLPDGWILEDVPRKDGVRTDRYCIEPVTGQRFRSAPEAHRFLAGQSYQVKRKALAITNYTTVSSGPPSTASRKSSTTIKILKNTTFDPSNPPEKISWVYSGDGKDNWNPLVEECMLPNYMKEQWSETFMMGMSGWKRRVPWS